MNLYINLPYIPVFIPFGWLVHKNIIVDFANVDVSKMTEENHREYVSEFLTTPPTIFHASYEYSKDAQAIDIYGEMRKIGDYYVCFSIKKSKRTIKTYTEDFTDIHVFADKLSNLMTNFSYGSLDENIFS